MIFSQKECRLLCRCLNAYLAEPDMHTEFGDSVIKSAIEKLENINALTCFSRKEIAAMCVSLDLVEESYSNGTLETLTGFSKTLPSGVYPLSQKLNKLYDAL